MGWRRVNMGRRANRKVETIASDATASTTLHQRYLYRNYLQIACCDLTRENHPHLWFITWDPSQTIATRPLALRKDGTWYCYGWDLTKNICEVFSNEGYINTTPTYSYTPYGEVAAEGTVTQSSRGLGGGLDNSAAVAPSPQPRAIGAGNLREVSRRLGVSAQSTGLHRGRIANGVAMSQPIQWSSEYYDDELGLVYYNYRHYNPKDGRWISMDQLYKKTLSNRYLYGNGFLEYDYLGLSTKNILLPPDGEETREPTRHAYYMKNAGGKIKGYELSNYEYFEEVYDAADLVERIRTKLRENNKCIENLLIISHGGYNGPQNSDNSDFFNGQSHAQVIGGELAPFMCKNAKVVFTACNAGKMKYYIQPFTDAIGSETLASSGTVHLGPKKVVRSKFGKMWELRDSYIRFIYEAKNIIAFSVENGHWIKFTPQAQLSEAASIENIGIPVTKKGSKNKYIIEEKDIWKL